MGIRAKLVQLIHKKEGIKHVSKEMGNRIKEIMKKAGVADWKNKGMSYDDAMEKTLKAYQN